jgi:hypothetical protein
LRALDAKHAEIRLRVHADIFLDGNGERGSSSWFTPAQFAGHMLIDREQECVVGFQRRVPDQGANVDLNVSNGESITVDIGRVSDMSNAFLVTVCVNLD